MERIDSTDVLALIRSRVAQLEQENATLREARDMLLADNSALRFRNWELNGWNRKVRASRDVWRDKAKRRRIRVVRLEQRIATLNPDHPMHARMNRQIARGKIKVAA